MRNREESRTILEWALEAAASEVPSSTGAEAHLSGGEKALTRFANNEIHQNVAESGQILSVRIILGNRSAWAQTTDLTGDGLRDVARRAGAIARYQEEDNDLPPLLELQKYNEVSGYEEGTARASGADRANAVAGVIEKAKEAGFTTAGYLSTTYGGYGDFGEAVTTAVANSNGLFAYYNPTAADFSATVMGESGSGWVKGDSYALGEIDINGLGTIAVDKAKAAQEPVDFKPGPTTVVLEPNALVPLFAYLLNHFDGRGAMEGRSAFSGKLGESVVGANISMASDPYHPLLQGRPFDNQGMPTRTVPLITDGMLNEYVYDRRTAAQMEGAEPTGHGFRSPNFEGAWPSSLVMKGGEGTIEDLIKEVTHGILVTRLWYNRPVDPKRVLVTGMTRDGTFLIEGGKITKAVKNMRYNQSVVDMLNNVEAMSAAQRVSGMMLPALRVHDFQFSSATTF